MLAGDSQRRAYQRMKRWKVFVPTPPNPTSGTVVMAKESETRDPGWSVEQAIRAVVSGGIIGPMEIRQVSMRRITAEPNRQDSILVRFS